MAGQPRAAIGSARGGLREARWWGICLTARSKALKLQVQSEWTQRLPHYASSNPYCLELAQGIEQWHSARRSVRNRVRDTGESPN